MQISLRKANAIQASINEVLKNLEFNNNVSINEFQDPETVIALAAKTFFDNVDRRADLVDALYDIRQLVATANMEKGIDHLLADLARLEKNLSFANTFVKSVERLEPDVIKGKLKKISERTEDSYYHKAEVETSIFTNEDLNSLRKSVVQAKKDKQKLQDKLLELNVSTTVTLSSATVETLTKEDLI